MPVLLFLARTLLLPALSLLRYAIATPAKWLRKGWLAVAFLVYEGTIAATDMGFEKAVQDQRVRAGKMRVMQKALKDGKPYTGTDMQQIQLEAEARAKGEFWELAKAQTEYSVARTVYGLKEIAIHPFAYRYSQIPKQFTDTYNQAVAMGVNAPAQLKGDSWDRQLDYSGYFSAAKKSVQSFASTWWSRRVGDVTHELRLGWDYCFGGTSDSEGIRVGGQPLERGRNPQLQAAVHMHEAAKQKQRTAKKTVEPSPSVETLTNGSLDTSNSIPNEPQTEPVTHYDSHGHVDLDYENRNRIEAERQVAKKNRFKNDRLMDLVHPSVAEEPHVEASPYGGRIQVAGNSFDAIPKPVTENVIIAQQQTLPYLRYKMKIDGSGVVVSGATSSKVLVQLCGLDV